MEITPKVQKRSSLSLRLHNKRHSASPQQQLRATNQVNPARSPSAISVSSDCGIECTPPHRKYNFDDSIDYSPKPFDTSFSPSGLLSQTLAIDSPEVGWRWARRSISTNDSDAAITTPDSAYAADSSTASTTSNSKERERGARTRAETQKRLSNELRREEYRKAYELEIRRAEKTKANEMLKQRCARLQEQLKEAELKNKQTVINNREEMQKTPVKAIHNSKTAKHSEEHKVNSALPQQLRHSSIEEKPEGTAAARNNALDEFFNDSDIDGFLIEATQQCESHIVELTQKPATKTSAATEAVNLDSQMLANPPPLTTPTKATTEKRTSFYMKFLEDDMHDDWFASLDEEVLQATQANKKQKTSLQRYKSMPTDSATATTDTLTTTSPQITNNTRDKYARNTPKFKRHASSHAISPNAGNYRGRQRKH